MQTTSFGIFCKVWTLAFATLIVALLCPGSTWVRGAPTHSDSNDTTYPLELQPPLIDDDADFNGDKKATDSYGNPIGALKPIETPDGRKVVSAQGLQFEIPNYASGITEIKKPDGDLLPPFIGELIEDESTKRNGTDKVLSSDRIVEVVKDENNKTDIKNDSYRNNDDTNDKSVVNETDELISNGQYENNYSEFIKKTHNRNKGYNINRHQEHRITDCYNTNTDCNTNNGTNINTNISTNTNTNTNSSNYTEIGKNTNSNTLPNLTINTKTHNANINSNVKSGTETDEPLMNHFKLALTAQNNDLKRLQKHQRAPLVNSNLTTPALSELSSSPCISGTPSKCHTTSSPAHSASSSNKNFNSSEKTTNLLTSNHIASKFQNPLPTVDPIAVADSSTTGTTDPTTTVEVESAQLVELTTTSNSVIPEYLLELNDPDIGGPMAYIPNHDNRSVLNVIAWDLLPPENRESELITKENSLPGTVDPKTNNIKLTVSAQNTKHPTTTKDHSPIATTHYTSTSATKSSRPSTKWRRVGTISRKSSTTTEPPTITTKPASTTRASASTAIAAASTTTSSASTTAPLTTTSATPTTTTTTTASSLDPNTFYKLEAGDSYTLPPWLVDFDDPDLDAAVLYVVPEDINEYNHTVERDILPPLEPFTDLSNILPAPQHDTRKSQILNSSTTEKSLTTTTPRTTTTRHKSTTHDRPSSTITTQQPIFSRSFNPSTSNPTAPKHHHITSTAIPTTSFTSSSIRTFTQQQQHQQYSIQTSSPTLKSNTFKPLSKNLPATPTDHSASEDDGEEIASSFGAKTYGPRNPFLPSLHDGSLSHEQPKPFQVATTSKYATTTRAIITPPTTPSTASTTTTPVTKTTTTIATDIPFEENPFDSSTIPAWLSDFDYEDLGPGVPYNYDPQDVKNTIFNNIMPPSQNLEPQGNENANTVFATSSSTSYQQSFGSSLQTTVHPSKVMLTHSFSNNNNNNNNDDHDDLNNSNYDTPTQQPSILFVPPSIDEDPDSNQNDANPAKKTPISFKQNIPAPFDQDSGNAENTKTNPSERNQEEPFPPLHSGNSQDGSSIPVKTTFTKSDEGKVITNNIFLNSAAGLSGSVSHPTKTFGPNYAIPSSSQKDLQASLPPTSTSGHLGSAGSPTPASSGLTKVPTTISNNNSGHSTNPSGANRYTGGFGGAPGILGQGKIGYAIQPDGSIRDPDHTYRPPTGTRPPNTEHAATQHALEKKNHGTFGGPPGILRPYDNSKAGNP